MRRTVLICALGSLMLCSGCVSPAERVPVNRSFASNSWLGARRQPLLMGHPSVREPGGFFGSGDPSGGQGATPTAGSIPARPLPSSGVDLVSRPSTPKRDGLPRFFPGLFGQGQGDQERLALARTPTRVGQPAQANSDQASANRLRLTAQRDDLFAANANTNVVTGAEQPASDTAVKETAGEVEKADADAPLLPVALEVRAYPIKPSPTLPDPARAAEPATLSGPSGASEPATGSANPAVEELSTAPPKEDSGPPLGPSPTAAPEPARTDRESSPASTSTLIDIPGLDRPPAAPVAARSRAPESSAEQRSSAVPERPAHSEHQGRPQLPPAEPGSTKFRVKPRPGTNPNGSIFETLQQQPRRGPISRLWHRMRGDG